MTDAEIATLEELYEEASPGPWEVSPVHGGIYNPVWMVLFPDRKVEPPDAHLIVAMHNALPKLIEALRESRTECERQMHYGVKQHEAAQDALRDRAAAFTRGVEAMRSETVSTLMGVDPSEEDSVPYALHIISNADPKDK